MSRTTKRHEIAEEGTVPWHKQALPAPLPEKRQAKEYIATAGKTSAMDLWSALHRLLEHDDGSSRVTRREVAKCMGVSDQLIHRWLGGPSNMAIETAGKIAAAMRADLHIDVVPWENNEVQLYVHSYSPARCQEATTKYISAITTELATPHPNTKMTIVLNVGQNNTINLPNTETVSRSSRQKIEVG